MRTHERKFEFKQNKLLEANHDRPGKWMDTRAPQTAERSHHSLETVATFHQAKKPQGKAAVSGNAFTGGELTKLRWATKKLNQAMREQKQLLP